MKEKKLYLVHCIDTEGPLYESLEETFLRLKMILGVEVEPSRENLKKIQNQQLDLGDLTKQASEIMSPQRLNYCDSWDKVDAMLDEIMNEKFRRQYADPQGNGWIYNWFIVDHLGYDVNPRRRDIGFHNIFDSYLWKIKETKSHADEVNWHFHPMSTYREAHMCATSFLRSPQLYESIARRIIDRHWFPSCFRAGFHSERPDSHWFLEQWIPYDFSNQGRPEEATSLTQQDVGSGRFGDWRRAPADWSHYHPSHDDYQIPGACRRSIFRCLNIGSRVRNLDLQEVEKAFARADQGLPTILSFTDHDYRPMQPDVETVFKMVQHVSKQYPDVEWVNSGAKQAAKSILGHNKASSIDLSVQFKTFGENLQISIQTNKDSFGPQPFLAVKTLDQRYLTDNLDLQTPKRHWTYTFDMNSIHAKSIDQIGIATNCNEGTTCVAVFNRVGQLMTRKA